MSASYSVPVPSGFSPISGPAGTVITVPGTGFTGLTAVWIGAGHDAKFVVVNDTMLRVTVPADATTSHMGYMNPTYAHFSSKNFTVTTAAAPVVSNAISGVVAGVGNAVVQLSGASTVLATANSAGRYSFSSVAAGTYTVAPTTAGVVFNPSSVAATMTGAAIPQMNFTGTTTNFPTYAISGTVGGATAANAIVTLTGTAVGSAATDLGGSYSFSKLPAGTYSLAVKLAGYSFSQAKIVTLTTVDWIFNSSGYTQLTLELKPTVANQKWTVYFVKVGDIPVGISVDVSSYGPTPVVGKWATYTIPLADLGVLGTSIYKFCVQDQTGLSANTWYADNVGFLP